MIGTLRAVLSQLLMPSALPRAYLRAVLSQLLMLSVSPRAFVLPLRVIRLPMLAVGLPMLFAAGCAETAQDTSMASQQTPSVQTTAETEEAAAPEPGERPELAETGEAATSSHEPVYLTSETTANMNLPFSDAVRVGNLLFLSGQIGNIPGTTDLAPGGIQGEARQTMDNIKAVLEANGSSMDRVIKATVMLADISEWPAFNKVYVTYFPGDKPARSAFAGSGLAFGARCEVEVIATVGE